MLRSWDRRTEGAVKALVQRAYGPVESSVAIEDVPVPNPGGDDVRVRVRFAGINPLDWKLVEGHYKWMSKARPPCGAGFDLAGEVHEAGRGAFPARNARRRSDPRVSAPTGGHRPVRARACPPARQGPGCAGARRGRC